MSEQKPKFYLTTPIYYVNARPHIGHAYTTIVGDVLARRHRLLGDDTFFLTGTDEHGQKIERSALAAGVPPQQFADEVSKSFKALWARMGITNDAYIRTTDDKHKKGAQKLFATLYEKGYIYLDSYTGAYCVSDETFVDVTAGAPCPDCGRITETVTEENFFFKLSEFQLPLLDLIESNTLKIENGSRRNEVLSFLRGNVSTATDFTTDTSIQPPDLSSFANGGGSASPTSELDPPQDIVILSETKDLLSSAPTENLSSRPERSEVERPAVEAATKAYSALGNPYVPGALKDLSISRSSFTWGIPVPEPAASAAAQKHVIYVWLDALANYMTAVGYGSDTPADQEQFKKYWPADLHLVGKEIIRFHCVYWPAFLLAADLPLPKAITAHGWLLFDNSKMSKSKGNIVRTETILDAFGTLCPHVFIAPTSGSTGLQPGESNSKDAGALAPEVRPPSQYERDLFASDVLRYFLLREIPFGQDGSFSFDALITRYNADLANGYGNLVSRTLSMIQQYFDGIVPTATADLSGLDSDFLLETNGLADLINLTRATYRDFMDSNDFAVALSAPFSKIAATDRYVSDQAPWKLAKESDDQSRNKLSAILYTAVNAVRIITAQLYPFIPNATAKVWLQLGLGDIETAARNGELKNLQWGGLKPGTKLGPLAPIFPRADKGLAQIMTDMENPLETPNSNLETESTKPTAGSSKPEAESTPPPAPDLSSRLERSAVERPAVEAATTPPTTENPQPTTEITIDDFAKIELRVAEIKLAERIPKADKLLRLEVDLGPFGQRQILSGIAEWYTPEELIGRRIVVITNLAPRKMRGLESHGMLLAASEEGGKPILATFAEDIALGSRLK